MNPLPNSPIPQQAWLWLALAAVCEVAWAVGLKYSQGLTRLWVSVPTILLMLASFYFLSLAMRHIPLGTAYAIWTGAGALGTVLLGMILFQEPRTAVRLGFLVGLLICLVGLKLTA